jgi:hypothetical protein
MKKPFKTVTTEYFEEFEEGDVGAVRRIRTITTETKFVGSKYDPIVSTKYEYL